MRRSKNMVLLSMDRTRYMMRLRKDKNTLLGVDRPIQKDTPLFETLTTINITTETSKKNTLTFNPQSSSTDSTTILPRPIPAQPKVDIFCRSNRPWTLHLYLLHPNMPPKHYHHHTNHNTGSHKHSHSPSTQMLRKHHTFHLYRHTFIIKKNPNLDRFGNFSWIV